MRAMLGSSARLVPPGRMQRVHAWRRCAMILKWQSEWAFLDWVAGVRLVAGRDHHAQHRLLVPRRAAAEHAGLLPIDRNQN